MRDQFINNFNGLFEERRENPPDETLISSYIQYLINIYDTRESKRDYFDIGIIRGGKKLFFIWSRNPLQLFEGTSKNLDNIVNDFAKELGIPDTDEKSIMGAVIPILHAGAVFSRDCDIIKNVVGLSSKYLNQDGQFNSSENVAGCKNDVKNLILNKPEILRLIGALEVKDGFTPENSDELFQEFLFDRIVTCLRSKPKLITNIIGSPRPAYKKEIRKRARDNGLDLPEHDIILIIRSTAKRDIIINIELKFGKHRDAKQLLCQHLNLKEIFKDATVKTILFFPYKGKNEQKIEPTLISNHKLDHFGEVTIKRGDFKWIYSDLRTISNTIDSSDFKEKGKLCRISLEHINKLIAVIDDIIEKPEENP
jgi:hypothetical protein